MKYDRDLAAIEYHDEKQKRRTFPTQVELLWEKKVLAVEAKFAFFPISSGEREKSSQINGTFRIRLKKCIRIFAVRARPRYAAAEPTTIFRSFRFSWSFSPSFCWRPLATMASV